MHMTAYMQAETMGLCACTEGHVLHGTMRIGTLFFATWPATYDVLTQAYPVPLCAISRAGHNPVSIAQKCFYNAVAHMDGAIQQINEGVPLTADILLGLQGSLSQATHSLAPLWHTLLNRGELEHTDTHTHTHILKH